LVANVFQINTLFLLLLISQFFYSYFYITRISRCPGIEFTDKWNKPKHKHYPNSIVNRIHNKCISKYILWNFQDALKSNHISCTTGPTTSKCSESPPCVSYIE